MVHYPLIFGLGGWEILIIVFVILLLFGGAKIPELMKGLGKGVKSFKEGLKDDEKPEASKKEENNEKVD
ncbi:MAG: twin-arginine translocase TatA/TatE family subunit [Candidatus Cryptobacteroides sp.]